MVQFNLLPDVKLEYIKARRSKRLIILVSTITGGASIAIAIVLFIGTNVLQRQHINNLAKDIEQSSQQLEETPDLDKILTVQNQLNVLDDLHVQKPAAARLGKYLSQIVPDNVTITELNINFAGSTMIFAGSAESLNAVNRFIDTLKFTTYEAGDATGSAFSSVVLADFGRSDAFSGDNDAATYQITLNFDPTIFNIETDVKLIVPNTISTRSAVERPASPFESSEDGAEE